MEYFIEIGYLGLFISAFLAATVLPLSSEVVLSALLINDYHAFSPTLLVVIATTGNVIGSLLNYCLGLWFGVYVVKKWLKMSDEDIENAEQRFQKYGLAALCFAWVPIIGDPLTVIAGLLRINIWWFLVLVTIGKFLRYLIVSYISLQAS